MASKKRKPVQKQPSQDSYFEALRTNRILALEDMLERETREWLRPRLRELLEEEKKRRATA